MSCLAVGFRLDRLVRRLVEDERTDMGPMETWAYEQQQRDAGADGPDKVDAGEALITCLSDDAELLRRANPECEIAANMEAAADMLEKLRANEEGAKEAFGAVVQDKRDLEAECKRLRELLAGTHAQIRSFYLGTPEVRLAAALTERDKARAALRAMLEDDDRDAAKNAARAALAGLVA